QTAATRTSRDQSQKGARNRPSTDRQQETTDANAPQNSSRPGADGQSSEQQAASAKEGQQSGDPSQGNGAQQAGQDGANTPDRTGSRDTQTADAAQAGRTSDANRQRETSATTGGRRRNSASTGGAWGGEWNDLLGGNFDRAWTGAEGGVTGPLTGPDFVPWSDRLRDIEEMIEQPQLRNDVAAARERARLMRQEFKRDHKKPDWAVVRLQVMKPLIAVR